MYLAHFSLKQYPFGTAPDPYFYFGTYTHSEAVNTLLIALDSGEGLVKITGTVGAGKTLLAKILLTRLGDDFVTGFIPIPMLTPRAFLAEIADEFHVPTDPLPTSLISGIRKRVSDIAQEGKQALLIIDEAQFMPPLALQMLRALSNLVLQQRRLIQIILLGQPKLDQNLATPELQQVFQRIGFHYELQPLSQAEVAGYIAHRLQRAGYVGAEFFTRWACWALHRYSKGCPHSINILAHKAMFAVFSEGGKQVKFRHIRRAANNTQSILKN